MSKQALPGVTTTGETITRYEQVTKGSKLDDVGASIYLSTRAHLADGTVTSFAIRAGEAAGTAPIVPSTMPSEIFDPVYYLGHYGDLQKAFGTSLEQAARNWHNGGMAGGRQGSPTFWSKAYIDNYPDVEAKYGATNYEGAINHYITWGMAAGRSGL